MEMGIAKITEKMATFLTFFLSMKDRKIEGTPKNKSVEIKKLAFI
jgi:hypothetical protein